MEVDHGSLCYYFVRSDRMVLCVNFLGESYTPGDPLLAVAA